MGLPSMLCSILFCLSVVMVSGFDHEAMQKAITNVIINNVTEFCLKSKTTGKLGVCAYIPDTRATWGEAWRKCTGWGGNIAEDHREYSNDNWRRKLEETNVAFLTNSIRYLNGMWLGGRMVPIEDNGVLEEDDMCDPSNHPLPPPRPPLPEQSQTPSGGPQPSPPNPPTGGGGSEPTASACRGQRNVRCQMVYTGNGYTGSFRCDCFKHRPYMCVTSKDKDTRRCPNSLHPCPAAPLCYKTGDPESNWFGANQQCGNHRARLPDIEVHGLENITAVMGCAGLNEVWTSESELIWRWTTNGKKITITNWEPSQPTCPPNGCIKMAKSGEWFAADCNLKSNFMCIKRNAACGQGCEVISYSDSSKEVTDDRTGGTDSVTNQLIPIKQPISTCQGVVIGVVIALAAVIIIFIIVLVVVLRQNRKYKERLIALTGSSQLVLKNPDSQ